jgi:uncharacterized protein (TIGR03435 family)
MRRMTQLASIGAVLAALVFPMIAQDAVTGGEAAKPLMMAKEADPDWDVVTVKPTLPSDQGDSIHTDGRRVVITRYSVQGMLLFGYGVQKSQLVGVPAWAQTERFDIDGLATVEGKPDVKQLQRMMQKILNERFGMKLHHEQRPLPVYALTLAKGGSKLVPDTKYPNGLVEQRNSETNGQLTMVYKNTSIPELAQSLMFNVDRPVVDQTGLTGRFDVELKWTADESKAPTDASVAPGLFTAIQEQLGLKLELTKAPVDVLVIDKLERPGAN